LINLKPKKKLTFTYTDFYIYNFEFSEL